MPAPNRNRYSDDYRGGSNAIRTLGAFLLCAVLSFALGFFVLARFWSSKPGGVTDGQDKNALALAGDHSRATPAGDVPAPAHGVTPTAQPRPRVVAPRIDPAEDEVQKPANLDENSDAKKPTSGDESLPEPSDETAKPADPPVTPSTATTDETKPKKHKKGAASDETQPSKAPDTEVAPPDSTDDVNDVRAPRHRRTPPDRRTAPAGTEAPANGGLYRVQIGVYSTREKAEEQAKSAQDKGFETTIHSVTSGDRTLYRVQHSAHRNRANAESEKQRLVDAGFDAYIANP